MPSAKHLPLEELLAAMDLHLEQRLETGWRRVDGGGKESEAALGGSRCFFPFSNKVSLGVISLF